MSDFPATLPAPLVSGYSLGEQSVVVRSNMETGAARQRRRYAATLDMVGVKWRFRESEMASFRSWFSSPAGAANGAAWFYITLADGNTSALVTREARFVCSAGNPPWQAVTLGAGVWEVSAQLEVR